MLNIRFFQHETKFVVGQVYATVRIQPPTFYSCNHIYEWEIYDEIGTIIPGSELLLGKYTKSVYYGTGHNRGRADYFINEKGEELTCYLNYDGTTRYIDAKTFMDERLPFLNVIESTGNQINTSLKNEHINRFLLNDEITKEICSFMNPNPLLLE